jgi:hypothetical protein
MRLCPASSPIEPASTRPLVQTPMQESASRFDIICRAIPFVYRRVTPIHNDASASLVERRTSDEDTG